MEQRRTQFDIWREKENAFERNTIIIADTDFPIGPKISASFYRIEFLRNIEINIEIPIGNMECQ